MLEVSPGRTMEISQTGSALFLGARTGNGTFAQSASPANTGTGVLGASNVANASALDGHTYALQFNVVGWGHHVRRARRHGGCARVDGQCLRRGQRGHRRGHAGRDQRRTGIRRQLHARTGRTAKPLHDPRRPRRVAARYRDDGRRARGHQQRTQCAACENIDQALEHILSARSDTGAKLRELDTIATGNDGRALHYQQTLSRLEDLDYNKALSHFAQQQLALEAAQKSFLKLTGLSLFEYL